MKKIFTLCMVLCAAFALSAQTVVLSEDFSLINDSTSTAIQNMNGLTHTPGWSDTLAYPSFGKLKLGKSGVGGYLQTPALDLSANGGNFTLSFDAEAWYNDETTLNVYVDGTLYEVSGLQNDGSYGSYTHFELPLTGGTASSTIRFQSRQASHARFFIDNILVVSQQAGPDTVGPVVTSVLANNNAVTVRFNEALDATTAQNTSNYTLDNNTVVTGATLSGNVVSLAVNPAIVEGSTYTLTVQGVADTLGNVMAPDTIVFSFGVAPEFQCATIAELRSKWPGTYNIDSNLFDNVVYKLTGEFIVTGVNESYRHQTFIQDATGAIVIDDNSHLMASYNVGDKISGIMGKLTCYYGMLQFSITEAYNEDAISVYNSVEPLVVSVSDIQDVNFMNNHQAELLRMNNVTFSETGDIENNGKYTVTQDGQSANCVWIHFWNVVGLSGAPIPTIPVSLIGVNKINYGSYYLIPRKGEDLGTGVAQYLTENDLVIYPNPVADQLNVSLRTDKYQVTRVAIYDINGKLVCSQPVEDNHVRMDVQGFSAGTYFLRLSDGKNMITTKFIKK
ncbi:MAG: T9SS type A sorting domain-containing protein [Bacteroidales bacterium]|nr:T9SS type A sorting domain-containing protein [Bacteroidales bacterium]